MKLLSKRQVLMLHSMLIAQSGGMDGLRDEGLLDSAVNTPLNLRRAGAVPHNS